MSTVRFCESSRLLVRIRSERRRGRGERSGICRRCRLEPGSEHLPGSSDHDSQDQDGKDDAGQCNRDRTRLIVQRASPRSIADAPSCRRARQAARAV